MEIARIAKEAIRIGIKKTFPIWQAMGLHVIPKHYYEPVPDTKALPKALWQKKSALVGINMNERGQIDLLHGFQAKFKEEYEAFPRNKTSVPYQYYVNNRKFEAVDGEILYCMIRHFKPHKIIEIGSGFSTYLSALAVQKIKQDTGQACELTAVEPYPSTVLKTGLPGLSKLIKAKVQDLPLRVFEALGENDILFIDSSHVLKIGSDVQFEYLDIFPSLKKGVLIHLHDIFLPAEYPQEWVLKKYKFWNEQYLLQAFLAFNRSFEVLWAASYMHLNHPDRLEEAFNSYRRDQRWPGSFWIRKTQ
jgi:hypothetical protein